MPNTTKAKFITLGIMLWLSMTVLSHTVLAADTKLSNTEIAQKFEQLDREINTIKTKLNAVINLANNTARQIREQAVRDSLNRRFQQDAEMIQSGLTSLQTNFQALSEEFARLQKRLVAVERRAKYADSINYEILSQLVVLENRIVSLNNSLAELNRPAGVSEASGSATPKTYRERYLQALTLHQNGRHDEAAEQFRRLIAEDRNHELADNAQYWLGECYYSLKQYQRAIIEFEKVRSFSNSDKGDDAQFKLGLCYRQLGNLEKARTEFLTLIATYPQSEFVENAKQLLK